ncbi:hypothetical protein H4R34_002723 [Dimargaris verticillata]|uniref:Large ribosomal subunit protein mL46 n=1 Tax=Dimargaris verticillata TaxID=2761393 RepID=A0A9W8B224_9FUNG|nr:hypothetical protein H4R34_002723 [Dimargaris verticillata]
MQRLCNAWSPRLSTAPSQWIRSYAQAADGVTKPSTRVIASIILQRSPVILPKLTPMERYYYAYKDEIDRREAAPFPTEFNFKKGTLGERDWKLREEAHKELQKQGWQALLERDPIVSGSPWPVTVAELQSGGEANLAQANATAIPTKADTAALAPRETEADCAKDSKSLERALAQTLYLLVKKPRDQHTWQFPQGGVEGDELLHEAAYRELREECGDEMNVWIMGRGPVGHYSYDYPAEHAQHIKAAQAKVFFVKGFIYAGQARVDNEEVVDFAWVTKDEISTYVDPQYWEAVKDLL